MATKYATDAERWAAISAGVTQKLTRPDLGTLPFDAKVQKLVEEALAEHWDDPIAAGYHWDPVERLVRAALGNG